ncbi:hypothetical protein ACLI09_08750 [Flavobacterium sp. RHBU_24]|uniref:hypothetical protein n=1 Tax=Flavobacterium sp. RHBU_24 TaxID=3391185 RepID=UPI003984A509
MMVISCDIPKTEFKPSDEGLPFKSFFRENIDYKSLGTYYINDEAINTEFELNDGYNLAIVKLGNGHAINYVLSEDTLSTFSGFYTEINGDYFKTKYYYDERLPTINNINVVFNGSISSSTSGAKYQEYNAFFKGFNISMNDDSNRIEGKSWGEGEHGQIANFVFFENNNEIYLLILTSQTRIVKDHTLLKMLNI